MIFLVSISKLLFVHKDAFPNGVICS